MLLSDPAGLILALMAATPSQRLGLVLFFGGAAMVLASIIMHASRRAG
ncbi:MAG: hypothetical protein HZA24_07015 [Nitrospirae bacterium]|nr:hypothetical protein [Nitrospirota bacterium]